LTLAERFRALPAFIRPRLRLFATRLLVGTAFTTSLMMTLDEHRSSPAFCRLNEGCDYVTESAYGRIGGVPLADFGVAAFAGLFALSLFPAWKNGRMLRATCILAGIGGAILLLIQGVALGHFCPFCVAIDSCAVGVLLLHLSSPSLAWPATSGRGRAIWTGMLAAAVVGCFAYNGIIASQPAPDYVRGLWQPGKINIISVTDFTCPYCRQVERVIAAHQNDDPTAADIHREIISISRSSSASKLAACAYFAAKEQGRGEAMAAKLFEAEKISLDHCLLMAADIGLDVDRFHAALESEDLVERLNAQNKPVFAGGLSGLPVTWVDNQKILGGFNLAALKSALVRARRVKEQ
jgi:predicted DsbA family dithiol-disulfide isomerase/uncharacterized membrane protein